MTTPASPLLTLALDFGTKRYGATLTQADLDRLGTAEFARQAAEMVERTIVTHYGAMPMVEEAAA